MQDRKVQTESDKSKKEVRPFWHLLESYQPKFYFLRSNKKNLIWLKKKNVFTRKWGHLGLFILKKMGYLNFQLRIPKD